MKTLRRIGFYVIALVFFVWAVFPFYYAVVTSLKTGFAVMTPSLWPHAPSLDNYRHIFELGFGRNILNSRDHVPAGGGAQRIVCGDPRAGSVQHLVGTDFLLPAVHRAVHRMGAHRLHA
ncbi:MAG: hypothetical protein P8015_02665 [Acidihalobacter sp.]